MNQDICVACGNELPTESGGMVCKKCEERIEAIKAQNEQIRQNSVTHETCKTLIMQAKKEAAKEILDRLCRPINVYLESPYDYETAEQRRIGANLAKAKMDERLQKVVKDFDIEVEGKITEECEVCRGEYDVFDAYVPVSGEGDYLDKPCEPGEEWVYHAKYCPNCGRKL